LGIADAAGLAVKGGVVAAAGSGAVVVAEDASDGATGPG
jgi:hypothetical protein